MPIDYRKTAEESIPEYKSRIAQARSELPQQAPEPNEIEVDKMKEPAETPLNVPETPQPTDFGAQIDANVEAITQFLQQPTEAEQTGGDLQQRILESLETLGGEQAQRRELEEEAGLPEQQQQLQELVGQLQTLQKESKAIPLQIQQEFAGRGATIAGVEPIEAGRLRENAIKSLQLSAQAQTIQGNIALAQQNIDSAISAEFAQEEARLQTLQQLYSFNRDELERIDEKRSQQLDIALAERDRLLQENKVNRENIYNVALTAREFGADSDIVQGIFNSATPEEAVVRAGDFLRDPANELKLQQMGLSIEQAKADIKSSYLNSTLKKLEIEKQREELALFKKYGGLTPSEYAKLREEEKDVEGSEEQARELQLDIEQVASILNSPALDSVVGGSFLTRSATRGIRGAEGIVSTALITPPALVSGVFQGYSSIDELSGRADDVVSLVENITSQEFLDKLVAEKGKGATFGQLSNREGDALRAAANAVSQTALRDGTGRVIAYDMSEKEFKNQFEIIRERMRFNYEKWAEDSFTNEEQQTLGDIYNGLNTLEEFNPGNW